MAPRDRPPFRADHVGSLLRPPALLQAREAFAAGRINDADLRGAEDEAILEAIGLQDSVGLRSATDGEMRRESWHMDFIYELDGVTRQESELEMAFAGATHKPATRVSLAGSRSRTRSSPTRSRSYATT